MLTQSDRASAAVARPAPFLWCSDCRTPLRTNYYALNERPVCGKCKPGYAARVARGTGRRAFGRATLYGLGAALAGAALIATVVMTIGFGRLICALAIGYVVARAVNRATGDYYGRRYQWLAVALTYFSVGLGSLGPVLVAYAKLDDAVDGAARGAQVTLEGARGADPTAQAAPAPPPAQRDYDPDGSSTRYASRLAYGDAVSRLGGWVLLLVLLPLLTAFTYGLYGGVIGLMAFIYAMRKAWDITGLGVTYAISGPHRVGEGPIALPG
jgi:hypothetical protein